MKKLHPILLFLLFIIQPIFSFAAPPDLPENWKQMIVSSIYLDDNPKQHTCMMKQANLPFQAMNCFNQTLEIGTTTSELFYAHDERFRPIVISCYCGNDNAPEHNYWIEALGKHSFQIINQGNALKHAAYPAYRYFMNDKQQVIPKNQRYQAHSKWECFAQKKGQYHYCRVYDKNSK